MKSHLEKAFTKIVETIKTDKRISRSLVVLLGLAGVSVSCFGQIPSYPAFSTSSALMAGEHITVPLTDSVVSDSVSSSTAQLLNPAASTSTLLRSPFPGLVINPTSLPPINGVIVSPAINGVLVNPPILVHHRHRGGGGVTIDPPVTGMIIHPYSGLPPVTGTAANPGTVLHPPVTGNVIQPYQSQPVDGGVYIQPSGPPPVVGGGTQTPTPVFHRHHQPTPILPFNGGGFHTQNITAGLGHIR